jgi:tetratricopeptide (TPR) repeat protein
LIDAGVSPGGQPYLILEYVEGKSIDKYCKQHALDVEARLRLFLDVLAAVAQAHANLIVHRDIKPSNVLVTDEGHVKLLFFDSRASFELLREAVEFHRRLGAPEITLIKPLVDLAWVEQRLSRFADAERHFKEAVALSLRLNGADHSFSLETVTRYGLFLWAVGRLRESEALLREAVQTAVRLFGPEKSFYVPRVRQTLAATLREVGKIEEADLLFRQVMAVTEKTQLSTSSTPGCWTLPHSCRCFWVATSSATACWLKLSRLRSTWPGGHGLGGAGSSPVRARCQRAAPSALDSRDDYLHQ